MGAFDKLFGGGKKVSKETVEPLEGYMPNLKIPVDEKFTIYFKKNGGKFIYCENGIKISLVDSISEALKTIKEKYRKNIPNNITALKHFQPTTKNKNDFLSYGSASKNVYLLLLEDY